MFKKVYVFRVKPKEELNQAILDFCRKNKIKSAVVLSIIGSLNSAELGFLKKLPGKYISKKFLGPLEIVSGAGTVAQKAGETILHLHLQISNEKKAIGGHLISGEIFSTAEVVLGETKQIIKRKYDNYTGLNELS